MINDRTLEALRNLAERPGTPAEAALARELLERLGKQPAHDEPEDFWKVLEARFEDVDWAAIRRREREC